MNDMFTSFISVTKTLVLCNCRILLVPNHMLTWGGGEQFKIYPFIYKTLGGGYKDTKTSELCSVITEKFRNQLCKSMTRSELSICHSGTGCVYQYFSDFGTSLYNSF